MKESNPAPNWVIGKEDTYPGHSLFNTIDFRPTDKSHAAHFGYNVTVPKSLIQCVERRASKRAVEQERPKIVKETIERYEKMLWEIIDDLKTDANLYEKSNFGVTLHQYIKELIVGLKQEFKMNDVEEVAREVQNETVF